MLTFFSHYERANKFVQGKDRQFEQNVLTAESRDFDSWSLCSFHRLEELLDILLGDNLTLICEFLEKIFERFFHLVIATNRFNLDKPNLSLLECTYSWTNFLDLLAKQYNICTFKACQRTTFASSLFSRGKRRLELLVLLGLQEVYSDILRIRGDYFRT